MIYSGIVLFIYSEKRNVIKQAVNTRKIVNDHVEVILEKTDKCWSIELLIEYFYKNHSLACQLLGNVQIKSQDRNHSNSTV